jgi:hypothetical protein
MQQPEDISYRKATLSDAKKLSILYKQVYIQTYGTEGVSDEFANFITTQFAVERLESIIHEQPDSILVAAYKNNLVGVAEIEYDKQTPVGGLVGPELNKLYILEWFCGTGIGRIWSRRKETSSCGFGCSPPMIAQCRSTNVSSING